MEVVNIKISQSLKTARWYSYIPRAMKSEEDPEKPNKW